VPSGLLIDDEGHGLVRIGTIERLDPGLAATTVGIEVTRRSARDIAEGETAARGTRSVCVRALYPDAFRSPEATGSLGSPVRSRRGLGLFRLSVRLVCEINLMGVSFSLPGIGPAAADSRSRSGYWRAVVRAFGNHPRGFPTPVAAMAGDFEHRQLALQPAERN
jgi:hypothetical protein